MLGKPSKRQQRKLEETGVRARAQIVSIADRGMAVTSGAEGVVANTELLLKTTLRVEPDGQPAFEVTKRIRYPQLSVPSAGMYVNVIFNPDDHDDLMIDRTASAGPVKDVGALLGAVQAAQHDNAGDPMAMANAIRESLHAQGIGSGATDAPAIMFGGAQPAATPEDDKLARLEKLGKLKEQGILTDEEFQAEKAKILAEG